MARQLSIEEKRNIILLYLDGHTQHTIAKKTRRSIGIVNAVISDWETGKGIEPESGLLSGEIREIARFMKEKNLSISDLNEMFLTSSVLKESGFNKASIMKIMRGFKGNSDEELEKYAETVKRIRRVEENTHLPIDKLQDVVTEGEEKLSKIRKEKAELETEIQGMKADLVSLRKQYDDVREDIEFSKGVKSITGAFSNKDVLSILSGLKEAGFDAFAYLRLKDLLVKVENTGISIDNFVSAAKSILALRDMGFSEDYLEKLRMEMGYSKLDFRKMVDQFRDYQSNTKKFDGEITDKENRVKALEKEIDEDSSSLAKLRGEEKILRESISSLESKKVELDSKLLDLVGQIKKMEGEYHKLMEMKGDVSKELEEARNTLRKSSQGFKEYDDLNMEIARLRNTYSSLDEEYRKKRNEVELGLNLFNLLTEAGEYNFQGLKLMCRNLMESPTVRDSDLQRIKLKAIETLVGLTQNSLVALSTTDGNRLKIKFVRSEEYYENMQKFLEIEEMKKEVEKIGEKIKNGIYEVVKAELESRGEDPAIRPYVKGAVKEVITEGYQKEVERISEEELRKSFGRAILSLSGFKERIGGIRYIVFFSPRLRSRKLESFYAQLDEKESQLKELMKRRFDSRADMMRTVEYSLNWFRTFFDIRYGSSDKFTYTLKHKAMQRKANRMGFIVLLTNTRLQQDKVLRIYREKDIVEKAFSHLKALS